MYSNGLNFLGQMPLSTIDGRIDLSSFSLVFTYESTKMAYEPTPEELKSFEMLQEHLCTQSFLWHLDPPHRCQTRCGNVAVGIDSG